MSRFPALLSPEVERDPQQLYRRLRADAPVHWDESVNAYLISRYADVAQIYKDGRFSTENYAWQLEPVHGRTILQYDGREHARKRAIISPYLRGPGLAQWEPIIVRHAATIIGAIVERSVAELTGRWEGGRDVDVVGEFSNLLPAYVIADMLGLPARDLPRFHGWYTSIIAFLSNLGNDPAIRVRGEQTRVELTEYLLPFIAERRADPGDDMISALCHAEADGERMSDEEIKSYVSLLLTAGAETTDKAFGSMMWHLLERPDRYDEVVADPELITAAIAETLRVSPPSQMNGRTATEDVEIAGTTIPAGSLVFLLIASANRDESCFADADTFDMHRQDNPAAKAFAGAAHHFGFGSGRHFCAGALLAKTELETAGRMFVERFPAMRLADGFVVRERGIKMRAPDALLVRTDARGAA